MYTGSCKDNYHGTVFENVTTVYKKVPGQSTRARVTDRLTPQFSRLEDSLQSFTCNKPLACKHKNNSMNNNVPLRAMNVDRTHFAALCTTRARA